jgi:PAT family beta-lactamase induction signal transducer AmpG
MLTGQGLLVILAGYLETATGLPETNIAFHSVPGTETAIQFQPAEVSFPETKGGDYVLVPSRKDIPIGTVPVSRAKADSIFSAVKEWNIRHGFYSEKTSLKGTPDGANGTTSGFALVAYRLSRPPKEGKEVVLNFGLNKGSKSFHLKEGTRFVFTDKNWNKPAFAIVQIDPKLMKKAEATFSGRAGNIPLAWSLTFMVLGGLFILFFLWHRFILPRPAEDTDKHEKTSLARVMHEVLETFASFFRKKNIWAGLAFLLLFRLGESQLVKLASPFMLDGRAEGGLGLTTGDIGLIYGTIGMIALTVGGILGGFVAAKWGLKKTIWWMAVSMNLPNLVYVYLAYVQPDTMLPIVTSVGIEQFGYGFGFTAYMLYMIYISDGEHKTAHYALCTGFMALGMMLPGMVSGWIQETVGYQHFFVWVMLCTIPGFILISLLKIDPKFGTQAKA